MPSGITQPFYDGESLSLPELVQRTARATYPLVVYDRDGSLDSPIPDTLAGEVDYEEKRFREDASELASIALWSDEEAEVRAHKSNTENLKEHLSMIRSLRQQRRTYVFMSAQVEAWEPPTEAHNDFKNQMRRQLDDTFGFANGFEHTEPPEKLTGEEYRRQQMKDLAEDILSAEGKINEGRERREEALEFLSLLKGSVEGWEPVEVPQRQLP